MKKIFLKIVIGVVLVCILFVCFLYTNNEIGVTSSKLEADIRSSQKFKDVSLPVIPPIVLVSLINWPGAGVYS